MLKRMMALVMASILLQGNVIFPLFARAEEGTVSPETVVQETVDATLSTSEETLPATTGEIEETIEETVEETTEETNEEMTEATEPEETIPGEPDSVGIDTIYYETADTLLSQTPGTGTTGGEWLVLGLARAEALTDSQKQAYLKAAKAYIEKKYNDAGKLHNYKPTENERLALALTAVGQDPVNFYGYDLLKALEDTTWTTSQGNNASAFALLAYRAAGYSASNTDALIQSLLNNQNANGGWAITTGNSDSDTTAMAIQALAPYYGRSAIKTAVDKALSLLSGYVNYAGQISPSGYTPSAENTAQVIVALTELGIDPVEDIRFVRNGKTLLDGLASFYVEGTGGFSHEENGSYNQMTTEQAFYALVSWYRLRSGKTSLYDMSDVPRDMDAVANVEALIEAIGEVTADSGAAIEAARRGYDVLSSYQKELVSNYEVLTAAEEAFAAFDKTEEDEAAADAVEALIAAIGTPVTLNGEAAILAARKAYDSLTATQKTLVGNYTALTAAEASLKTLKDKAAAQKAEELIEAIGTVTLDREYAIEKARKTYNALTTDQKRLVGNYQILLDAEEMLEELQATVSVKFTLLGCRDHGDNGEVHTLADGNLSTWISRKTYMVGSDATVREVFEKALTAAGMTWENPTGNYVESVNGIGEFTNGNLSGWMYTLNGTHPNLGVNQQKVKSGDEIVFHYTDDYTREEGSSQYQNTGTTQTTTQNTQTLTTTAAAADMPDAYQITGDYLEALGTPNVGSIGGEWMVIGLARSGRQVPDEYYANAVAYIAEKIDESGRLHRAKSTDNARMILALTAIGRDARNIEGHNLLLGLSDMEYVRKQGINGPIWALIAFDSGNYPVPKGNVTREALLETILSAQLSDGGWALSGSISDPDMTGMALQALAPYAQDNQTVNAAAKKAVQLLSDTQNSDGSWSSIDGASSESIAQVIVALTALGINPDTDPRFVKGDRSALDALLSYFVEGGGFRHTPDGELDGMSTEQSYYALTAYHRFLEDCARLYDMTDISDYGGDPAVQEEAPRMSLPTVTEETFGNRDVGPLLLGICAGIGIGFMLGLLFCGMGIVMWIFLKKQVTKENRETGL